MTEMKLFVPLTKVDEEKRLVYGVLAEERVDKSGEIMDYAKSKPNFEQWSGMFKDLTNGKSAGNLRVMHTPKVAGHFEQVVLNDAELRVEVVAKITDDQEWAKVKAGDYTGFSVGGSYGKKWKDDDAKALRYEAKPSEGSLADNPAMYGATFACIKADGAQEMRKFHVEASPDYPGHHTIVFRGEPLSIMFKTTDGHALAQEVLGGALRLDGPTVQKGWDWDALAANRKAGALVVKDGLLTKADEVPVKAPDTRPPAEPPAPNLEVPGTGTPKQKIEETQDDGVGKVASVADLIVKVAERKDAKPSEGESKYGDVAYADETNKKYPIDTSAHIRAAWNYINKPKNAGKYSAKDAAAIKRKIVAAWKKKISAEGPSSAEKVAGVTLTKAMYTVQMFAGILESLESLLGSCTWEEAFEGDAEGQALNVKLAAQIDALAALLLEMVAEEVGELHPDYQEEAEPMAAATPAGDLQKIAASIVAEAVDQGLNKIRSDVASHDAALKAVQDGLAKKVEESTLAKAVETAMAPILAKLTEVTDRLKKVEQTPAAVVDASGRPIDEGQARIAEKILRGEAPATDFSPDQVQAMAAELGKGMTPAAREELIKASAAFAIMRAPRIFGQ